jgi:hypothetical protein
MLGISLGSVLVVVVIGMAVKFAQMSHGGRAVAEAMGGVQVDPGSADPAERRILNVVEEMAIASGVRVPPVFLIDEPSINAFAAGNGEQDAVIGEDDDGARHGGGPGVDEFAVGEPAREGGGEPGVGVVLAEGDGPRFAEPRTAGFGAIAGPGGVGLIDDGVLEGEGGLRDGGVGGVQGAPSGGVGVCEGVEGGGGEADGRDEAEPDRDQEASLGAEAADGGPGAHG